MRFSVSLSLTVMLAFAGVACAQDSGCLTVKKISASHHALQQGGEIIELTVKLVAAHCNIPVDVKSPMNKPELSVEGAEGLAVTQPVVEIGGFDDAPVIDSIWMGSEVTARFTVHAFREASLGKHTIPATLTYTAQDSTGNTASHTLALSIPVKVIAPPKPGFWDEHPDARNRLVLTGEVLLAIVAIPILMVGQLLGFNHWDC